MSTGSLYLDHGLPLHGAGRDEARWHRRAAMWATAVTLGIVGPEIVWTIAGREPHRDPGLEWRLALTLRDAMDDLERRRQLLEWQVRRLIDTGLEAREAPAVIEARMAALVATQPQDIRTIVEFCGWAAMIQDRLGAWRWRNSPRGRRMRGQ